MKKLNAEPMKFENMCDLEVYEIAPDVCDELGNVLDAMHKQLNINITSVELYDIYFQGGDRVGAEMVIDDDWYEFDLKLSDDKTHFNVTSVYLFNDDTSDEATAVWSVRHI